MPHEYQIRLKDQAGALQIVITDWDRLQFTHELNGVGGYILEIDGGATFLSNFVLDAQVEIWREVTDQTPAIPLYLEYEGLHRTQERRTEETGRSIFVSEGVGYTHLLTRRVILYPSGAAQADKTGPGETVMKEFVDENAGPGATFPPRSLASGVMTGLTVQADGAAGVSWSGGRAYRNLLDVCREISNESGVDFEVVGTGAATYEFQAQATPLGADRTTTGLDLTTGLNAAGNAPVVFSLSLGNMQAPIYRLNRSSEGTVVIPLGQGIGADRTIVQRQNVAAIADSPWNRIEISRQANAESTTAGLNAVGDDLLEEVQARETFNFGTVQIPGLLYGRDYFVGDLITADYEGITRNKQITSVTVEVAEGVEDIQIEVADLT